MKKILSIFLLFFILGCDNKSDLEEKKSDENLTQIPQVTEQKVFIEFDLNKTALLSKIDNKISLKTKEPMVFLFMTSWCKPCLAQIKVFNELYKKYPNINIVGVLLEDFDKDFKEKQNIKFNLIRKDSEKIKEIFEISAMPSIVITDKNGEIFMKFVGNVAYEFLDIELSQVLSDD